MSGSRRLPAALAVLLGAAALGASACGSSDSDSGDSDAAGDVAPALPPPTGAPAGLVRGTSEGVTVTTSPGGAHVQLNDEAGAEVRSAVDGNPVKVSCRNDAGDTIESDEREWAAGSSSVTLLLTPEGTITECTVLASGAEVTTTEMSPIGS